MHLKSTDRRKRARLGSCYPAGFVAIALAAQYPTAALAHDTWFAVRSSAPLPGTLVFALGTGNQFPQQEFPIAAEYVKTRGCRQDGRDLPLTAVANTSTALVLQLRAPTPGPVTCWAELVPFEVTLEPDKIALYLDEINASASLRQTWAAMAARGLKWTEHYVKHARVEVSGAAVASTEQSAARTAPMGMDVVLESGVQPRRSGEPLVFRVLRDGKPMAGFAIELRGTAADQATWLTTDAQGRVSTVAPAPGRWVLRGTDLRLSSTNADVWESDFVNLAFDVR